MQGERLVLRIPQPLLDDLKQIAARERNGVSAVIRRMLSRSVELEARDDI